MRAVEKLLIILLALSSNIALGAALTAWPALDPYVRNTVPASLEIFKGMGTDSLYPLEVDQTTGALPVEITGGSAANPAASPTGAPVPSDADYQGLNNGGTLIGAKGDSSGRTIVAGDGVAGTPAGGVLTVQGDPSGTPIPVSGTVSPITSAGTFQDGAIAFGSLTTSYQTVVTTGGSAKFVALRNNTNGTIVVSLNAGSTTSFTLDPGDDVAVDLATDQMNIASSTALQAKYSGSAPTAGSFRMNVGY